MDLTQLDVFLPGCPPNANRIPTALESLLCGEIPYLEGQEIIKFGYDNSMQGGL